MSPAPPTGSLRSRERACPRDFTPLTREKLRVPGPDVTIDRCPKCHGVFLDKNELLRITGDTKLNTYLRDRVALDSDSRLVCPHCGGIMDMEPVAGVEVEVCLTCFGLGLDAGEMEALKARPNPETIVPSAEKDAELRRADEARRRQHAGEARAKHGSGRAARIKTGIGAPYTAWHRALDEFVRRYL